MSLKKQYQKEVMIIEIQLWMHFSLMMNQELLSWLKINLETMLFKGYLNMEVRILKGGLFN